MKRILLSLGLAVASCTALFAQSEKKNPGGLFIKGGLNFSSFSTTPQANIVNSGTTTGLHVGVVADFPIGNSLLSFQPGFYLSSKGSKTEAFTQEDKAINPAAPLHHYQAVVSPLYIELPFNFVAKAPLGSDVRAFFGFGPYVAMGIGGRVTGTRTVNGESLSYDRKIIYKDGNPYQVRSEDNNIYKLNRFDLGLNALIGIEAGRLILSANYGYGFSNVNAYSVNENDINRNRVVSISAGYNLTNNW